MLDNSHFKNADYLEVIFTLSVNCNKSSKAELLLMWLSWLERHPVHRKVVDSIPDQARSLVEALGGNQLILSHC